MNTISFTLVSEGSSDRALIPVITWLFHQHVDAPLRPEWADLRNLSRPPRGLEGKVAAAVRLYPCDVLFVHRDADRVERAERVAEIHRAIELAGLGSTPAVCLVPVRALEAWFFGDEGAIRRACGDPSGSQDLALPPFKNIESLADPKARLQDCIRRAADQRRRRRRRVRPGQILHRIAELTDDFSPLRQLAAFQAFESELLSIIKNGAIENEGWV